MPTDLPAILYKYRDWADVHHQRLLTHQELWFSSPKGFNDPFDTKLNVRYDSLPDLELQRLLYHKLRAHSPLLSEEACLQQAAKRARELRSPHYLQELHQRNYEQAASFFGFVSLAEEPNNILLWAHYARSHTGFALGFHTHKLHADVGGMFARVTYQPVYPRIVPGGGDEDDSRELTEVLNTKAALWAYEREVRITKPAASNKVFSFTPGSVAEIIIGCAAPLSHRQDILATAQQYPQAAVFEAAISENAFAIELQRLR